MNSILYTFLTSFIVVALADNTDYIYFNTSCYDENVSKVNRALRRSLRSNTDKNGASDWLNILKFPDQYDAFQRGSALNYARCNYMKIFKEREHIQLDRETLKEILLSDVLNVDSEEVVFNSVVEWVRYNCVDLENHIHLLLSCIRFPLLSLKYIMNKVEPYANTFEKSRPIFLEALRWHLFKDERSSNILKTYKPRKSCWNKYICFGSYYSNTAGNVDVYDQSINKWTTYTLDVKKYAFGTAIIDNKLLVIGGKLGDKPQNTVEAYDLSTKQISSLRNMNEERYYPAAVVVGKNSDAVLYVFGGWGVKDALKTAEKWDPASQKWNYIPSMQYTRSGCAAALYQDKIYIVGGRTVEHGYTTTVEVYDLKTNTWGTAKSIEHRNAYATLVATSNYLYLLGGYNPDVKPVSNVERYDPDTNTWTSILHISSSGQVGGMVIDNKVVSVGGRSNNVQIYDEEKRHWESLASVNIPREGFCMEIPWSANFKW